ncbi:hypothetical protein EUGRSUZ_J02162 [Eucalyptus grandis]|uniref:Uncharacterized protein n=2 Tax=Eucalyptus grandis TaxID=71139 RepID=A0ACC3J8Y8_EUCGR|nr:hypothetical protein EUGRSUZ_J02162 [Eucalyptus grandis]
MDMGIEIVSSAYRSLRCIWRSFNCIPINSFRITSFSHLRRGGKKHNQKFPAKRISKVNFADVHSQAQ